MDISRIENAILRTKRQLFSLKRCAFIKLTLLGMVPGYGFASETNIEQIVVVANKIETPVNKIASNVTVFTKQGITDDLATSISQVFRYSPGIEAESTGSRFGTQGVNIRGIGGNRVALLIDGVPLSDQFDVGNFSNASRDFLNAGFIQRTEILHGSASAYYGSDAIGGVVASYTINPMDLIRQGNSGGEVLATYSAIDNSSHLQSAFASGNSSLGFLGAVSVRDGHEVEAQGVTAGKDDRDYTRRSALLKIVADNEFGQNWKLSYLHQDSESQTDQKSFLGAGRFRATTKLLGDDEDSMDILSGEYHFTPATQWLDAGQVRAFYKQVEVEQQTLDERLLARAPISIDRFFSYQQATQGLELRLHKEFNNDFGSHRFSFGLEYQERRTEELRDGEQTLIASGETTKFILGELFPLRDFPISETVKWGSFIDYSFSSEHWTAIAALRGDHYDLDARADAIYLADNPETEVVTLSQSDVSPKLGLIHHLTPRSNVYAQYAQGFRAPPFEDANIGLDIPLFNIRAIPNPELKSESSDSFDVGFRWQGDTASYRFGLFRTEYSNFIETKVRLGIDPISGRSLFQSQNLAQAVIKGVEGGWQLKLAKNFDFSGSFYLAEGTNLDTQQPLNSVGPEQLVLGLGWHSADDRRALRLQGTFTGRWDDIDESSDELFKPNGYEVFDLFFSQQLREQITLRVSLTNLTNQQYWNWAEVGGLEVNDPVLPVLARPGRALSLSVGASW